MNARWLVGMVAPIVMVLTCELESAPAFAAGPPTGASPSAPRDWLRSAKPGSSSPGTSSRWSFGKIGAAAALVGLGTYALLRRRRMARLGAGQAKVGDLRVVAATRLGPKSQVVMVRVGSRLILLGATESSINSLGWLDPPDDDSAEDQFPDGRPYSRVEDDDPDVLGPEPRNHPPDDTSNRSSSRFRQILADAVFGSSSTAQKPAHRPAPADAVADQTTDRFTRSAPTRGAARERGAAANTRLVNVEGQAAGLLARLNRNPP